MRHYDIFLCGIIRIAEYLDTDYDKIVKPIKCVFKKIALIILTGELQVISNFQILYWMYLVKLGRDTYMAAIPLILSQLSSAVEMDKEDTAFFLTV